jgi:hypothetical protein
VSQQNIDRGAIVTCQTALKRRVWREFNMAIFFVTPRYIKEARALLGAAKKIYHYRKDLLSDEKREELAAAIKDLEKSVRIGWREEVLPAMEKVDRLAGSLAPPQKMRAGGKIARSCWLRS